MQQDSLLYPDGLLNTLASNGLPPTTVQTKSANEGYISHPAFFEPNNSVE